MIFVSTGRCGTTRLAQILGEHLPDDFAVVHQMRFSRIANIVGNIMYYCGESEVIKEKLYRLTTKKYTQNKKHFISTDPLTAMTVPKKIYENNKVCIVHIVRGQEQFAKSFFELSRKNVKSFIAHNFIPLWQIGIWPLHNLISPKIQMKYRIAANLKNEFFEEIYQVNPNFIKVRMDLVFEPSFLMDLVNDFFSLNIDIDPKAFEIKAN